MPAELRRASIVEAARQLLVDKGITFTTREVAEAAGIAESTVFRHFDTKDDLIRAVIADVFDPRPLCLGLDATPADLDLPGALDHDLELMRAHFQSIGEVMVALHHRRPDGPRQRPDGPRHGMVDWYRAVSASLGSVLSRYRDSLRISIDKACALLTSAVLMTMRPGSLDVIPFNDAELTDVILNGIAIPPSPCPSSSLAHSQESACS